MMTIMMIGFLCLWVSVPCSSAESTWRSCVLKGDLLFLTPGATASQCQSRGERLWECKDGEITLKNHSRFEGRISGPCHAVTLKTVRAEDCDQEYRCTVLEGENKNEVHTYRTTGAITAPPHDVLVYNNVVSWQPPSPQWQAKPIQAYEIKSSCNSTQGSAPLHRNTTVFGNSTILKEIQPGVCCNVTVTAVSSDVLGVESALQTFCMPSQPAGARQRHGLIFAVVLFFAILLSFLLWVACTKKNGQKVCTSSKDIV